MDIDTSTREQIKLFIRGEVKKNGGVLNRTLKAKLKLLLTQKLKRGLPQIWTVTAPYELPKKEIDDLAKLFSIEKEQIHTQVDSSLIGGFTLQSDSKLIDASINGYITNLETQTI